MKNYILSVAVLGVLACSGLHADVLDFEQSSPWSAMNGQNSFTQSLVDSNGIAYAIKFATNVGTLTKGVQGIGIRENGRDSDPDEVESPEVLTLNFSVPTLVKSFRVEKLFGFELEIILPNIEVGQYSVDGGLSWSNFVGQAVLVGDGGLAVNVNSGPISAIRFTSDSTLDEFALNQIDVVPTPEPASILLFGMVAMAAAGAMRKRLAKR